ncbi:hypothetical protein P175DRAFT_0510353 [Aspergillus ochraceoroseus IBT 24754]|uniref:Yeast cell wall synthesis Kre9/Knh1-like N-terminal domain-containing protein n=3 Tax=Aspergillus subgen. Nidulantes TaxID=2720870 RepID=A0A0F8X9M8_9EURO|nr:uncharacterized protein P175DRAFT_0510353 [Aspergillus ochraceoroseus IBT 24754]KKK20302.1 hypothetical protein ARAM_002438 [Aspergillus rambellii]KKK24810.1 hypothetical protein AOCH_000273 [Aspergillus ochraceoroseus]PTU20452.1 hypothetical protein P175DRAFT_0510353 [Aspergillus ochraceoroseus IBT 24754]
MRSFALAIFSAFVAIASARTQPDYSLSPEGNPIRLPGLNDQVPIGEPYTITWDPTTTGTVSLVLLRGPSTNVVPLETLVEGIPNSGKYSWTPAASLEPDVTHYGLLLIVDATGEYQYSTQFGISKGVDSSSSSTTTTAAPTTALTTASTTAPTTTNPASIVSYSTFTPSVVVTTTRCNCQSSSAPVPTGTPAWTSKPVIPAPSQPTSVNPESGSPSTSANTPVFTGAAAHNIIGRGALAAALIGVLAL